MGSDGMRRTFRHAPARGFALAVTLWLLAAMAIAAGFVTLWAREEIRAATVDRERLEDELALFSTRETVLYLAATRDMTVAGLPTRALEGEERALRQLDDFGSLRADPRGGEIRLDGHHYLGASATTRFAVQDETGLVALVAPSERLVDGLLTYQGAAPESLPRLRDAFFDYSDMDTLRRLNGAEAREYEREGLSPPPNRRLLVPAELRRILGWSGLGKPGVAPLEDIATTFYSGAVNLNTMPRELLPLWISGCPEKCDLVAAHRAQRPFRSSAEVQMIAGVRLPGDPDADYRFLPDESLRLTLWGRSGPAWRLHVRLTPLADQAAPWAVLAAYPVPRPPDHAPAQPTGSDLLADAPPAVR